MSIGIIAISGRSCTGSTTIAKSLATRLSWQFISAGARFRQFCRERSLDLISIPSETHVEFDADLRSFLESADNLVVEGRYVGLFVKNIERARSVLVTANVATRAGWCLDRDHLVDLDAALIRIGERDSEEDRIARELYNTANFADREMFDMSFNNSNKESVERLTAMIVERFGLRS